MKNIDLWESWAKDALMRKIKYKMEQFYKQTNGTMKFPESCEGDLLKMVYTVYKNNHN